MTITVLVSKIYVFKAQNMCYIYLFLGYIYVIENVINLEAINILIILNEKINIRN
jgi:hypothetical protein